MAETSYIIQNGRRLNLKDAAARKSIGSCSELKTETQHCLVDAINELCDKVEDGVGGTGEPGKDGVSCTHEWNGTVLTVTSASGTSSADLKGEKGDTGRTRRRWCLRYPFLEWHNADCHKRKRNILC